MKKLIIFDVDGTLIEPFGEEPLEGVQEWFASQAKHYHIALATNQGGVGLRVWMEQEGFGDPEKYPTQQEQQKRLASLVNRLNEFAEQDLHIDVRIAYRYRSKTTGRWSPIPLTAQIAEQADPQWSVLYRKPSPGMLIAAYTHAGVIPADSLMVGDWEEDELAAHAAGMKFEWADKFFGRNSDGS